MEKLTKQSEAILNKISEEAKSYYGPNPLTKEEIIKIRKGLTLIDGAGVFANIVVKAAGFMVAAAALWHFVWGGKS